LRDRRLAGAKFLRQHQIGPYFLDFYCEKAKIAVELDGSQHLRAVGVESDELALRTLMAKA
jgi:very-short-patch-repair endonuclease